MVYVGSKAFWPLAAMSLLCACAATPAVAPTANVQSILENSTPAHGSIVRARVSQLELRFSPPARLDEVTVSGSDGLQMPMMVTAVGEGSYYSLPLPDLAPGAYTVEWKATSAGTSHQGSIRFHVR